MGQSMSVVDLQVAAAAAASAALASTPDAGGNGGRGGMHVADSIDSSKPPQPLGNVQRIPPDLLATANFARVAHAVLPLCGRRSIVNYQKDEVVKAGRVQEARAHFVPFQHFETHI